MRCRICDRQGDHRRHIGREMMFGYRDVFDYVECAHCGCVQIDNIPDDLDRYYPDDYYSFNAPTTAGTIKQRAHAWARNQYMIRGWGATFIETYLRRPPGGPRSVGRLGLAKDTRILDIGCGAGALLVALQRTGFTKLTGADPFIRDDLDHGGGLRILRRTTADLDGQWDLVMMHHAFEHIPDQHATMADARRLLPAGGTCLVRIPTTSSYAWRTYGVNWVQMDPPRHLYLHSRRSLELVAERAGFIVEQVIDDSNVMQFWGSEQYRQDIPLLDARSYGKNPAASMFSARHIKQFRHQAMELNALGDGDQACFYLRAV